MTEPIDAQLDRQYRLGYEQAWREWSSDIKRSIMYPTLYSVPESHVRKMEVRLEEVKQR